MLRQCAAIDGKGRVSVIEEPVPECGPNDVLVEVKASMISPGTELRGVKALREEGNGSTEPPRTFGYQNAGVVLKTGAQCRGVEVGQRVACMGGGYAPHATHGVVPRNLVVPIPDSVSFDDAAANSLAATALQAIRRADLRLGESVAVAGLGIIGQICCQLARLSGCRVLGMDLVSMRRDLAQTLGAAVVVDPVEGDLKEAVRDLTDAYGLDAAVMAFGGDGSQAFTALVDVMKRAPDTHQMGRIVVVGGCEINTRYAAACGNIDVRSSARTGPGYHDEAWERGRDYPRGFVEWDTRRNLQLCLRLVSEGLLQIEPLITHRFPLAQAAAACDVLVEHPEQALAVVLLP